MGADEFNSRYNNGDTPWDHGMVDHNLTEMIAQYNILPCKMLEIGCGTGENALWLAGLGYDVVACDFAPAAIEKARAKTAKTVNPVCFMVADFMHQSIPGAPYGFIFDRGCLHCISDEASKSSFVEKAAGLLTDDGWWLTLAGNADEGKREVGPPQLSAVELVRITEPAFEIISLRSGHFGSNQEDPPRAWICLMRKRRK